MGAWLRAPPELIGCTNVVVDKRGVFGRGCGDAMQEGSVTVMTRNLPPKVVYDKRERGDSIFFRGYFFSGGYLSVYPFFLSYRGIFCLIICFCI